MAPNQSPQDDEAVRRSYNVMPVPPVYDHDVRFENRNAEELHHDVLEAARLEHERVRAEALRVFELNTMKEEQIRAQREIQAEQERIRLETVRLQLEENRVEAERQNALAEIKRRELEEAARKIPVVPPKPPTPPPVQPPAPAAPTPPPAQSQPQSQPARRENIPPEAPRQNNAFAQARPQQPDAFSQNNTPQQTNSFPNQPLQATQQSNGSHNTNNSIQASKSSVAPAQSQPPPAAARPSATPSHILPDVERYSQIHQNLKQLRQYLAAEAKTNKQFKTMYGDMRRKIRQTVGQLTGERGANKQPMNTLTNELQKALRQVPSPGVDPSNYMISTPSPVEGAANNGDQLPALFIYLLNIFSKCVVSQFINEAGVRPETADPIGVVAISIFAQEAFLWRGKSLIDILMAKMRVTIPVVFGFRGNEKSEEGRKRLGWQRNPGGGWIDEQIHSNRMVGLAAGYAALSLRNFSRVRLTNPWPPYHYWTTMASIVSTPTEEASSTQYTVLRYLIENNEQRFLDFYGIQAVAALRVALVDFPSRAPASAKVAAGSLSVLADRLDRDKGLRLAY
ncbi:Nucleoporin GLE1 protein [Rutstroemia sp. NJR-2017a BBW]|nr:Nucleoporin GLE1 protein [Rutstroemia sp. NJR-2017a BBW]